MSAESLRTKWRNDFELMAALEAEAHDRAMVALDPVELPRNRTAWRNKLSHAFDQGACYMFDNYERIKELLEKRDAESSEAASEDS